MLSKEQIIQLQEALLKWFSEFGRQFPWRKNKDPYSILLIEKLLQQTSVRPIIGDIYQQLLQKFPAPAILAQADVNEIREIIRPLGLYYRANDLVKMAKDISEKFGGVVPLDLKSLLSIYGVGDYSARALLSFSYGQDIPVVDTNVARILYRVFGITGKMPSNPARNKYLIDLMTSLIPAGQSCEFNWAVIDLGALVCSITNPSCKECPLRVWCSFAQARFKKIENQIS